MLTHRIELKSQVGRGSRFSVEVPLSSEALSKEPARQIANVDRSRLLGTIVLCIDNEPQILDGMQTLLGGWGCRVLQRPILRPPSPPSPQAQISPNGLLVDYHLDKGNGVEAIAELRRRFGADLPAILITADHSPKLRDTARADGIQVLNKPIKPAALRALMARWRAHRAAAAE